MPEATLLLLFSLRVRRAGENRTEKEQALPLHLECPMSESYKSLRPYELTALGSEVDVSLGIQ